MSTTYSYDNRQIERDFHFVEYGEKCKGSGLPAKAGNDRCKQCKYNGGAIYPTSFGFHYWNWFESSYVRCKHPEAKDSEGSEMVRHAFYEYFEKQALCALCY